MAAPPSNAAVGEHLPDPPPHNKSVQPPCSSPSEKQENAIPATFIAADVQKPSFASVVSGNSPDILKQKVKSGPFDFIFGQPDPLPGANLISQGGRDVVVFEDEATNILTASLKWALIGKFSHSVPSSASTGKFFMNLGLSGNFELKWLSNRQFLIVLNNETDYLKVWLKWIWHVEGCPLRVFKWSPLFNLKRESSIVPLWVSLHGLPFHLFDKRALFLLASQLGRPLMIDSATASKSRVSLARFCVEIDLLKPLKSVLVVSINNILFEQPIVFEDVPKFCAHCCHIGHNVDECFIKCVDLKPEYDELQIAKRRIVLGDDKWVWVAKPKQPLVDNSTIIAPALDHMASKSDIVQTGVESSNNFKALSVEDVEGEVEEGELGVSGEVVHDAAPNSPRVVSGCSKLGIMNDVGDMLKSAATVPESSSAVHDVKMKSGKKNKRKKRKNKNKEKLVGQAHADGNLFGKGCHALVVHEPQILEKNASMPTTFVDSSLQVEALNGHHMHDFKSGNEVGVHGATVPSNFFTLCNVAVPNTLSGNEVSQPKKSLSRNDAALHGNSGNNIVNVSGSIKKATPESFSSSKGQEDIPFLDMSAFDHLINKSVIEAPLHAKPLKTRYPGTCYSDGDELRNSDDESDYEFEDEEEDENGYSSRGNEYIDW